MKLRTTMYGYAMLGIFLTGMAMPEPVRAKECEAYEDDATADDKYAPNNTIETATPLENDVRLGAGGDPNCGVMFAATEPADEYDYYKIDVPAGNTGLQVDLRFKYSLGDMTLRLYGTDGTTLLAAAATEFDNEFIDYNAALDPGTYYIRVFSSETGNNRYSIGAHVILPAATYTVTSSAGSNGSVTPLGGTSVTANNTAEFTLAPASGYTASRTVNGNCPAGSWSDSTHYTTGPITENCTADFTFGETKLVTSSAGTGGSVTPNGEQNVALGDRFEFTVTAAAGYTTDTAVDSTCTAGTWNDNVYTTGAILADCSVEFSFTQNAVTYTVTSSAGTGGSVTPNGAQTVNSGEAQAFTVIADNGYTKSDIVTGDCPTGTWSGNVYTTGAILADCSVGFSFTENTVVTTYTVTSSAGTGGSVTPSGAQTVNSGEAQAFTVTANNGYTKSDTVTGDCPAGTWSGNVYTTGAILADCSVEFSFTPDSEPSRSWLQAIYRLLL